MTLNVHIHIHTYIYTYPETKCSCYPNIDISTMAAPTSNVLDVFSDDHNTGQSLKSIGLQMDSLQMLPSSAFPIHSLTHPNFQVLK